MSVTVEGQKNEGLPVQNRQPDPSPASNGPCVDMFDTRDVRSQKICVVFFFFEVENAFGTKTGTMSPKVYEQKGGET